MPSPTCRERSSGSSRGARSPAATGSPKSILQEAHVAVVGGDDFGAPEHIRISYATSRDNLKRAFDRIAEFLKKLE